jgi:hypothetical protein
MNVIATAKIIAARIKFLDRPAVAEVLIGETYCGTGAVGTP